MLVIQYNIYIHTNHYILDYNYTASAKIAYLGVPSCSAPFLTCRAGKRTQVGCIFMPVSVQHTTTMNTHPTGLDFHVRRPSHTLGAKTTQLVGIFVLSASPHNEHERTPFSCSLYAEDISRVTRRVSGVPATSKTFLGMTRVDALPAMPKTYFGMTRLPSSLPSQKHLSM